MNFKIFAGFCDEKSFYSHFTAFYVQDFQKVAVYKKGKDLQLFISTKSGKWQSLAKIIQGTQFYNLIF